MTALAAAEQFGDLFTNVAVAHERFADENCGCAGRAKSLHVSAIVNTALGDENCLVIGRAEPLRHPFGRSEINFEGFEVAIVDTNETSTGCDCTVEFGFVVYLYEGGDAGAFSELGEFA